MTHITKVLCSLSVVLFYTENVLAGPIVVVGDFDLAPNTAGQTIQISVNGGDSVQGLNFNVQIGDGGTDVGGSDIAPRITDVDILSGSIFDGNNTGQSSLAGFDLFRAVTTTTNSGSVSADGLLATLTIDTTGFGAGTWPLQLQTTAIGASDFAGVPMVITDGSITVVPEPATVVMTVQASILCLSLGVLRWRRCTQKS